ncbi:hypothetical protein D3C81_1976800 [compost metagenome]
MRMPGSPRTASSISARTCASTATGSSSGIMRRSIFMTTLPGTTLVFVPPSIRPTSMVGESMPATFDLIFFSSGSCP